MFTTSTSNMVRAWGIVTTRQQRSTDKGVVFVILEDESGSVKVMVWKAVVTRSGTGHLLLDSRIPTP